jgi:aminoacyl-tRNA hydrolase
MTRTTFIGITGSAGKTTTKDLVDSILSRHFGEGCKGIGSLNFAYDIAYLILRTRRRHAYCVTEIAIAMTEGLDLPLRIFRPSVGVVTNVGGDHLSAFGSLDGIAEEKSKLVRSLPPDGIAILNADDPRVLAMRSKSSAHAVTYGMSAEAMVRGHMVECAWPDRLTLTVDWNGESVRVKTQLCGSHWASVVLAAIATGVAMGVPLSVTAEAIADVEPFEGRMSPVELKDGVTFIRDDWKAPYWTVAPTFDFVRQARASRKIIVIGTLSDYSGDSSKRYVDVARQALALAQCVVFVGPRASAALRAKRSADDKLFAFASLEDASTFLGRFLQRGDLVLLKGSTRTDHLERLILARSTLINCWRSACGRIHYCDVCDLLHSRSLSNQSDRLVSVKEGSAGAVSPSVSSSADQSTVFVIALGNPEERRSDTRHNVGVKVVDIIARRLSGEWVPDGDLAKVCRHEFEGIPICLIKPLAPMNDIGPVLSKIAARFGFGVAQCILVHDDLDMPVGAVRARGRGGDGGHGGVRSILQAFQDDRFRRVKIGIGKPTSQPVVDYVLTPFPPEQTETINLAIHQAAERVLGLVKEQASTATRDAARKEDTTAMPN